MARPADYPPPFRGADFVVEPTDPTDTMTSVVGTLNIVCCAGTTLTIRIVKPVQIKKWLKFRFILFPKARFPSAGFVV